MADPSSSASGLQPITDPLPDPPKEEGGMFGKLISQATTKFEEIKEKVAQNEKVQQYSEYAVQKKGELTEYGKEKAGKVVEMTKEQYEKAMENERIAGAVTYSLETAKVGYERAKEIQGKIVEKTKERTTLTRERSKALWARGKGKIVRVKNNLQDKWGKSAQETLLMQEEAKKKWETMKLRGADDIVVSARSEFTCPFVIEKGTVMRWSFRVKDYDVGFGVRLRLMRDGGAYEEDVLPIERFDNTDTIEGSWVADADRTIVLVFDNTYSKLRSKTVAYLVGTEKAAADVMTEVIAIEQAQEKNFAAQEAAITAAEQAEAGTE